MYTACPYYQCTWHAPFPPTLAVRHMMPPWAGLSRVSRVPGRPALAGPSTTLQGSVEGEGNVCVGGRGLCVWGRGGEGKEQEGAT